MTTISYLLPSKEVKLDRRVYVPSSRTEYGYWPDVQQTARRRVGYDVIEVSDRPNAVGCSRGSYIGWVRTLPDCS